MESETAPVGQARDTTLLKRCGLAAHLCLLGFLILLHETRASRDIAFINYSERVNAGGSDTSVVINSDYGGFTIRLRPDLAPKAAALVLELARKGNCSSCKFYRHEPVPPNWAQNNFWGPPYALLQGSLADVTEQPAFENDKKVPVAKGHACFIPGSKEFFIATDEHPEWGASHIIWGEVISDLSVELQHPFEPFHTLTNGDIVTRWLDVTYPFTLSVAPSQTVKQRS